MKYLKTICDKDIFSFPEFNNPISYKKRTTVKAIVINEEGKFAFVTNPVHKFYLLAGGGAESNNFEEEIKRECAEEVSCDVIVLKEVGRVQEFRNRDSQEYETVCFLAKFKNFILTDLRTEDEKKNGLVVVWLDEKEAQKILLEQVEKVKNGEVGFYNTAFNTARDQIFFEEFLKSR